MTDVPFGVLLSGGLDSSLVAAVASRHLSKAKGARQWGSQLHTFCIGLKVNSISYNSHCKVGITAKSWSYCINALNCCAR